MAVKAHKYYNRKQRGCEHVVITRKRRRFNKYSITENKKTQYFGMKCNMNISNTKNYEMLTDLIETKYFNKGARISQVKLIASDKKIDEIKSVCKVN